MMVEMNGDLKWKADEAIDEAYRRGYEDGKKNHEKVRNDDMGYGYQRGLEDAWECVLKIGELDVEEQKSIFGTYTTRQIALAFTADQAMKKIMDYEYKKNQDNLVIEDIKAEIRQTVDEEAADDERWSRGLHYSLCIIDKHIKGERRSE